MSDTAEAEIALDLKTFITYRFARLQSKLNAQAIRLLKKHSDLSLTEWRIMAVTAANDQNILSDLVRATGLDKGQLSRACSSLVDKGYLVSTLNKDDQRQNLLKLSASGRTLFERMLPIMRGRQRHLTAEVAPDDLATALRVIDIIEAAATSLPQDT